MPSAIRSTACSHFWAAASTWLCAAVLGWGMSGVVAYGAQQDDRQALYASYREKLDKLAADCDQKSLTEAAACTRAWLPPHDPNTITLFVLPQRADWQWPGRAEPIAGKPPDTNGQDSGAHDPAADKQAADKSAALDEWRGSFRKLREAQAEELFDLAQQAVSEKRASLAHELVLETAHENPDHKQARRLLGYVPAHDRWLTPFAAQQEGQGKVWHPQFGWLRKAHVARYERGERFYQNHWIGAAEDARVHSDIKHGWQVESAHYRLTTNHSLEEGVNLCERLERLYTFWQTLFAGYVIGDAELLRRFEGRSLIARDAAKHDVQYFRNRQEYNEALRQFQPQIDITLGIYFDTSHVADFFAGPDQQSGTIYHEATHQLFQETRSVVKDVGRTDNFWILEAIACYMESLTEHESGVYTLGGADVGRLPAARLRRLRDDFYVPLGRLVTYSMETLQHDPDIAKLYSQSAGLATFLMHADGGRYRPALIAYIEAVYSGRASAETLSQLTRATYPQLDQQYIDFLKQE